MQNEENLNIETINTVSQYDNVGVIELTYQDNNPCDIFRAAIVNPFDYNDNIYVNGLECSGGDLITHVKSDKETKVYMNRRGELIIDSDEEGVYSLNSDGELIYTY